MGAEKLVLFRGEKYLNLVTFRKSGRGVATPLWFVELDGALYVRTPENSGKVKRLRNNSRVRIAPCDMCGRVKRTWLKATARFVDPARAEQANELLKQKYGLAKALINFGSPLRGRKSVVIMLQL